MVTTFCVSGSVLLKAGSGVNSAITNATLLNGTAYAVDEWIIQAEGLINTNTRYNFTDVYATLNDDIKFILEQTASDIGAMYAIQYDMSGYTSRAEAGTMLDVLRDRSEKSLSLLRDKKQEDFIVNA